MELPSALASSRARGWTIVLAPMLMLPSRMALSHTSAVLSMVNCDVPVVAAMAVVMTNASDNRLQEWRRSREREKEREMGAGVVVRWGNRVRGRVGVGDENVLRE